jgi:peptidyl-prolyl cis-trans isomerase C
MPWPSKSSKPNRIETPDMKKQMIWTAVAAAVLATLSINVSAQNIAIVNGKAVPKARVEALMQQVARSGRPITPEVEAQVKEEVIAREIFMQEAQKRGLDATDDFKAQIELARQTILIRELFAEYQKTAAVTDAEVQAEYDKFVAANGGKEYRARHILVETEDQAKAIYASLKKGAKFEDLAKKMSKDPGSGANGGDLDWAAAGNFVKEFSDAMVALNKGETTAAAVKSQFGFHIIRLDDVRDTQLPKLEEVKPQIMQQMTQQRMAAFQQELRAKAKVE